MYLTILSEPNSRIKSSSSEMKKCEEPGRPGARSGRATAVNAARLVAFGAHDVQAARLGDADAEFDVGAAAAMFVAMVTEPRWPRARRFRFLLVKLGVEDGVDNPFPLQHAREVLADFHRDRADEHRPLCRGSL